MGMKMTMDGSVISVMMDGDVGYADPGQPVEFATPDLNGYQPPRYSRNQVQRKSRIKRTEENWKRKRRKCWHRAALPAFSAFWIS